MATFFTILVQISFFKIMMAIGFLPSEIQDECSWELLVVDDKFLPHILLRWNCTKTASLHDVATTRRTSSIFVIFRSTEKVTAQKQKQKHTCLFRKRHDCNIIYTVIEFHWSWNSPHFFRNDCDDEKFSICIFIHVAWSAVILVYDIVKRKFWIIWRLLGHGY